MACRPLAADGYLENKYFFLDNIYRHNYNMIHGKGAPSKVSSVPEVTKLEVWRSIDNERATALKGESNRVVR